MNSAVRKDDKRIFLIRVHCLGDEDIVPELEWIVVSPRGGTALFGLGFPSEVDLVDIGYISDFLIPEDVVDILDDLVKLVL